MTRPQLLKQIALWTFVLAYGAALQLTHGHYLLVGLGNGILLTLVRIAWWRIDRDATTYTGRGYLLGVADVVELSHRLALHYRDNPDTTPAEALASLRANVMRGKHHGLALEVSK